MSGATDSDLCLWCFDLLAIDRIRVTDWPLETRRKLLNELVNDADEQGLQFSGAFEDPLTLLTACDRRGLEGIVSKRRDSVYRSGPTKQWVKTKTATWRAVNADRYELFEKKRP
jgi:ATP-dependent DNA ligase